MYVYICIFVFLDLVFETEIGDKKKSV